ncbi:MAG: potassium-transporting ATPase subunit KdpB [Atopobiaceae bacterium]|jgi:K+-transporting ATPase ATPase B chain|nr:potassium-transporting ATPase subunit KdpB [Atopobiaceae bacterium]MCH4180866.1 potassium-transporting ATPase subunit KdpB [Atopobiaceae bacterium]MCH4213461.1 potassium-transporting ATPase subunit KdpB [Atopobiaceae bacterium]MCH4230284.1 potassium-transporting ATPase subunit KdpB [Atopobiaceae bacterium]MCH4277130.1 potassium-transporting ATPase subunit KdpB [Atopobiaceae bacterium]
MAELITSTIDHPTILASAERNTQAVSGVAPVTHRGHAVAADPAAIPEGEHHTHHHDQDDAPKGGQAMKAVAQAFAKLAPRTQLENPVMFLVYVSAVLLSALWLLSLAGISDAPSGYVLAIVVMLWLTVLFSNFAEALAEGRGKAQADALRASKRDLEAHKVPGPDALDRIVNVNSCDLRKGDCVVVYAGEQIPADGTIVDGAASVDESAITGESAPVIREAGGDRSSVVGMTTVLSDQIVVEVVNDPGESFLDKMISMVEGASRKKTPNELALQIFLVALCIIFILVVMALYTYSDFSARQAGVANPSSVTTLVALLVCLAPTTIGALLSAIGIAGMSRLNQANVLAMSGRAIEAAGDVDVLLLDKTGTITLGNRRADQFVAVDGHDVGELAAAAQLSSLSDETPEGRSIVALASDRFGLARPQIDPDKATFIEFSAKTRMSGIDYAGDEVRKGAADAVAHYLEPAGVRLSAECDRAVQAIAQQGATPLVVTKNQVVLGVIALKDIIKPGVAEKFADLRRMGIRTIMVTGDNPTTAAAIAAEAGVDDFLAEATPEGKLETIRRYQAEGHMVAMTGDGTNDAPALAQADVAVAMNTGTQAAKEAGNMVDLDSSPTKLIDIVRIGKQLLMTRGSLTTFSIANDVAKYFAIIPALFTTLYPGLQALNVMGLHSPQSAVLAAIIYNAFVIVALIPLALKGVRYREVAASKLLSRNLLVYGLGGFVVPFVFIKLIDIVLVAVGMA